mmetsp:Transcript_13284/g.28898  ORF Transcript_13284/g.28898 Transcript_13284/m.28898 type:complete len:384 (-) Transcript_13284:485-1636(-)
MKFSATTTRPRRRRRRIPARPALVLPVLLLVGLLDAAMSHEGGGGDHDHRLADGASWIGSKRDRAYAQCPQVPSLRCQNGSVCEAGVATFGKKHDHLGLQTHESGFYCKCLPGYIGHECAIQVDDCEGETGYNPSDPTGALHSCYHGSTCRTSDSGSYCDCKSLNKSSDPIAAKYAGLMCQHESTSMCAVTMLLENSAPDQQFCTNHGKCVRMVSNSEPHPGCVCRDGYQGDHCEIRADPFAGVQTPDPGSGGGGNKGMGTALFSLLIITIVATLAIIGTVVYRSRKSDGSVGAVAAVFKGEGMKVPSPRKGKKPTVNVDDLDPDGSATLGGPTGGDLELSESRPEPEGEKADSGEENFKIGDDEEEEEGGGEASEPSVQEIV